MESIPTYSTVPSHHLNILTHPRLSAVLIPLPLSLPLPPNLSNPSSVTYIPSQSHIPTPLLSLFRASSTSVQWELGCTGWVGPGLRAFVRGARAKPVSQQPLPLPFPPYITGTSSSLRRSNSPSIDYRDPRQFRGSTIQSQIGASSYRPIFSPSPSISQARFYHCCHLPQIAGRRSCADQSRTNKSADLWPFSQPTDFLHPESIVNTSQRGSKLGITRATCFWWCATEL
ncbi:hypothetical protein VTL71DRAFT_2110 [Oculimacula yallundae]|uniref:Uncharacterized protein n=1 Tax=Oculimacula yallundae TaxID=86028 RepID=A0ABR4C7X9_9HELO